MIRPARLILGPTLMRATFLWFGVRLMLGVLDSTVPRFSEAPVSVWQRLFDVEPVTSGLAVIVVAALVLADIRALRERTFLANLGVPVHLVIGLTIVTALALESIVALAFRFA